MDRGGRHRTAAGSSTPRGRGRRSPRMAADPRNPVQADGDGKSLGRRQTSDYPTRTQGVGQSAWNSNNRSPGNSYTVEQSLVHDLQGVTLVDPEKETTNRTVGEAWTPSGGSHGVSSQQQQRMPRTVCDGFDDHPDQSSHVAREKCSSSFSHEGLREKYSGSSGIQSEDSVEGADGVPSLDTRHSYVKRFDQIQDKNHLLVRGFNSFSHTTDHECAQASEENSKEDGSSASLTSASQFDICPPPKAGGPFMLKPSLLEKNREKRNIIKRSIQGPKGTVLRDGMVLLKNYISTSDQVKIVKTCRLLGIGNGGFYQPGYRDGAKLHLHMMCLGKNWDPVESKYVDFRPVDGAKPPAIPDDFVQLVRKAINYSHEVIKEESGVKDVKNILPIMSPDICLVNFYSTTGRLGLHQDHDESRDSLGKGLPVVSFSIGDSAEFLFGDQRDIDKADKVVLESGDVLIFGGKSRLVFHGVARVIPNSAPKTLVEETNLRPGRINLTFRQY